MESAFEIIAEPNRRAILSLLVSSQQSVGEIERQLRIHIRDEGNRPAVRRYRRQTSSESARGIKRPPEGGWI